MEGTPRGGIRAGLVACVLAGLLAGHAVAPASAGAAEVVLPLTVPFELLLQRLTGQVYYDPGGTARLWPETSCRHLTLDHPAFDRRDAFLRFVTHGDGVAGTRFLWFCLNALRWRGYVEALTTPYVTPDWQLKLRVAESSLYDEQWKKGGLKKVRSRPAVSTPSQQPSDTPARSLANGGAEAPAGVAQAPLKAAE